MVFVITLRDKHYNSHTNFKIYEKDLLYTNMRIYAFADLQMFM